jgi:hypothetical protein|tara:strand:+ start:60 stop:758 length:699 start_codon:yes stop_codon:yes gene_type:complete
MTDTLTTEGFLGLGLIMAALLVANLSVCRMLKTPWGPGTIDSERHKSTIAAFFVYMSSGTSVVVLTFLGVLIGTVAPGRSQATPQTFGLSQIDAANFFYAISALAVVLGGFGAIRILRDGLRTRQEDMKPTAIISGAFAGAGPIYALLAALLVMTGSGLKMNADYIAGAQLILLGSVLGSAVNFRTCTWFRAQLQARKLDADALNNGIMKRALLAVAATAIPAVPGIVILAN